MSRGIFDLFLCGIREIRGCAVGYGNCSHDNQEIVQAIRQQAVMILGDILLCKISWSGHRQFILTEKLPMSGCLGDLVREVERFEEYTGDPG